RGGGFAPVLAQPDHLAVHDIRQNGPEALALATLDLIEADMPRLACGARAVPLREEGFLGATGFAPAHAVAHRCVPGWHRLTAHADLLPQAAGDTRLRVGEFDALGADPTRPADNPSLRIDQRHVMRGPREVIPRAIPRRPNAARSSATAAAGVA